jgi:iron complex outermembrane receptor protein
MTGQAWLGGILWFALASPAMAEDSRPIEEMVVVGRAQEFYRVDDSALATKAPTALLDTPQAVQVLTAQLIEDQAAREITDLYRSISGISFFSYSGVTARGFRQDEIRYDGVRGDPFAGFAVPQLFNTERIEVLKGVSGMLYGGGEPGGLINYVLKKPQLTPDAMFSATMGNRDLRGISGDATGPIGDSSFAYRLGGFYEEGDGFRHNAGEETNILTGQLGWGPTARTEIVASFERYDVDLPGNRLRGVPVNDAGEFLTDISFNTNEASDFLSLEASIGELILSHTFSDDSSARVVARYVDNQERQQYHESRGPALPGSTLYLREFRDQKRSSEEASVTADFVHRLEFAGAAHQLLFGADYFDASSSFAGRTAGQFNPLNPAASLGSVQVIDLQKPVYGHSGIRFLRDDLAAIPFRTSASESQRYGVYLQDQVAVTQRIHAIFGARYDDFEEHDTVSGARASDDELSYRGGLLYKPVETVSLYASYGEGFQPQGITDPEDGGPFDPETSRQIELGVKADLFDGRMLAQLAVYEIVKEGVLVANPDPDAGIGGVPRQLQIGEATSEGLEIDIVGDLTDRWTLQANYAYNDTRITGGSPGSLTNSVGDEFVNAPDHAFGLWTRYELPMWSSAIAGGLDYVGERISFSGQDVKDYMTFDASWITTLDSGWQFQLNVRNLFDKEYAASGFIERTGHFPGEPRTLVVQISRRL